MNMFQVSNKPQNFTFLHKSIQFGSFQISESKLTNTIFNSKVISDSNTVMIGFPSHKTLNTQNQTQYSFLSYSQSNLKAQLQENLSKLDYQTQTVSKVKKPDQKIGTVLGVRVLANQQIVEIEVIGEENKETGLETGTEITLDLLQSTVKHKIRKEIVQEPLDVLALIRNLQNWNVEAENQDSFVLNSVYVGLVQRNKKLEVKDRCLRFVEFTPHQKCFSRVGVKVSVKNEEINAEFYLWDSSYTEDAKEFSSKFKFKDFTRTVHLDEDVERNLKLYISEVNKTLQFGQFSWSRTLKYKNSYSALDVQKNVQIYSALQNDLKLISLHTPFFNEILFIGRRDIKEVIYSGQSLKLQPKFTKLSFQLSETEYLQELVIHKIFEKSENLHLINRFYYKKTVFDQKTRTVTYVTPSVYSLFSLVCSQYSEFLLRCLIRLINELASLDLFFCNCRFPVDSFNWHEEKLVFSYQVPLHKLLQKPSQHSEESLERTKMSVLLFVLQYHRSQLSANFPLFTKQELNIFQSGISFFPLSLKIAEERIKIFNANRISRCVKYLGICQDSGNYFLVANQGFVKDFDQLLEVLELGNVKRVLKEVFLIVEEILSKNSDFCCFDFTCLGVVKKNKLKIMIHTKEEVDDRFKAPEVINGRSHKSSLIYSFGKLAEYCFTSKFLESEIPLYLKIQAPAIETLIKSCCEPRISKRIPLKSLKKLISTL